MPTVVFFVELSVFFFKCRVMPISRVFLCYLLLILTTLTIEEKQTNKKKRCNFSFFCLLRPDRPRFGVTVAFTDFLELTHSSPLDISENDRQGETFVAKQVCAECAFFPPFFVWGVGGPPLGLSRSTFRKAFLWDRSETRMVTSRPPA